jgi:hypothetical protein
MLKVLADMDILPNAKIYEINGDPAKGYTFDNYVEQWTARTGITDPEQLAEFDRVWGPDVKLGNLTKRQIDLLRQYNALETDGEREALIVDNPEIAVNPREEWLKSHPEENARLALWGQAKLLTKQAYDKVLGMARELDIPDSALVGLPPRNIADTYFKYQEAVSEFGAGSAEAKLLRLENPAFDEWGQKENNWQPVTGNVEALKITVQYRGQDETYDALDSDSEKLAYLIENPEYAEARYRREAYEKKYPADMIEEYVDFREATVLQGYNRKLYLWKHQDFYRVAKEIEGWEAIDFSAGTTVTVGGATMKYYNPRG